MAEFLTNPQPIYIRTKTGIKVPGVQVTQAENVPVQVESTVAPGTMRTFINAHAGVILAFPTLNVDGSESGEYRLKFSANENLAWKRPRDPRIDPRGLIEGLDHLGGEVLSVAALFDLIDESATPAATDDAPAKGRDLKLA